MSGKNTAVFGLYPNHSSAEHGVDTLKEAGFRNTTSRSCFRKTSARKTLVMRREAKLQKVLRPAPERVRCWGALWVGWPALALWPSPD